jgi:hypothetical protein
MKIKQEVLDLINNPMARNRIGLALGNGEQAVAVACRQNSINGPLTKAAAIKVIREETGLTDSEILEDVPEEATK